MEGGCPFSRPEAPVAPFQPSTLNPFQLMNADESNPNAIIPAAEAAPPSLAEPKVRQRLRDELRAEEWAMHRELMAAARTILKSFYDNPHKTTVADLARLVELASKLGRLATQPDCDLEAPEPGAAVMIEFHAALRKVYARRESEGRPLPAGDLIDAVVVAPPVPGPVPSGPQSSTVHPQPSAA